MFYDWKVGQTGWVRLRNGQVARATNTNDGTDDPVRAEFLKTDEQRIAFVWLDVDGLAGESSNDAIEHLEDCTGFDWKPATVKWREVDYSMQESVGSVIHEGKAVDWRPCDPPKFKVGDWVRIISHDGWCDGAKKERPIGSYRKIADVEPFVYRIGDWVKVNTGNSRDLEHPHGAIRRIRAIEQRGLVRFFLFDGFSFGAFEEDVVPTHSPIDQPPPITWQLSAKVVVRSR